MNTPQHYERLVERLSGVTGGGTQRTACCPAHEDRTPSLSVGLGEDGQVLLHCHAGCPVSEIVAALDLTMADLFPPRADEKRKPKADRSAGSGSPTDWAARAEKYRGRLTADGRAALAAALRLPVEALDALPRLGFGTDPEQRFWTFPECDAADQVVGISRRLEDGRKLSMKGGKRGLTVPAGWQDRPGPVVVPEGPSDVLAATHAGLAAVGRPSNSGGVKFLADLFRDLPADREVVVLGENDRQVDGDWPGRDGAKAVARKLAKALGRPVRWVLPPDGAKDARAWLADEARGGAPWPDRGAELLRLAVPGDDGDDGDDGPGPKENATPGGMTRVKVTHREHRTNDAAVGALAAAADLYQRGNQLVRVVERDPGPAQAGGLPISRPAGPCILTHDEATLREELTRVAEFVREKVDAEGDKSESLVHPPGWCVKAVLKRKRWPGVRELTALVGYPVLLPGGRVLTARGYDEATGIFLYDDFSHLDVPTAPTREDARRAVGVFADDVDGLLCDFPFESAAHRSAWVCALLTPLARYAYAGPSPLFLFDKNVRGAGGSLLADLVATIATGADFARTTYAADKEEVRKVITAFVIAGDPLILFDNVTGKFGDAALDAALTGVTWKGRILGVSQMYEGPLTAVFYASANNCEVGGDAARRILPCRLESQDENPEDRTDFRYRLPDWARDNRAALLTAALTVLKAYDLAGRPEVTVPGVVDGKEQQVPLKPWGSFGGWSGLVRSAVVWAGLDDPAAGKDQLRQEADRDAGAMKELLAGLAGLFPDGTGFTAREVAKKAGGDEVESGWERVADQLATLEATTPGRIGYRFRHYRRRVFGEWMLDHAGGRGNAGQPWAVVPRPRKEDGGEESTGKKVPEPDPSSPSSPSSPSERRQTSSPAGDDAPTPHRHRDAFRCKAGPAKPLFNGQHSASDDGDDASRPEHLPADGVTMGDDDPLTVAESGGRRYHHPLTGDTEEGEFLFGNDDRAEEQK